MLKQYSAAEFKDIFSFSGFSWQDYREETSAVQNIIADVRENGDDALRRYAMKFDGCELSNGIKVGALEFDEAVKAVPESLQKALKKAMANIERFHRQQLQTSFWQEEDEGIVLGQIYRPLDSAGAYVPGGTAAYPSSVLMTAIPAKIAGVSRLCICTPADSRGKVNPVTLFAAAEAGVTEVYKSGGAQAIAAMAYGTETVIPVDKIVGPGNIYVTLAKKEVYGDVGIDMLAGPSEVMVVAGGDARADYIAADLLSQAEHGALSRSFLVTDSAELARRVNLELERQLKELPRRDVAAASLQEQGGSVITENIDEIWDIVNLVAPEHLEILLDNPRSYLSKIKNAGSIFLGDYAPEPLGDYWAGLNHVLPTGYAARFSSPLGVNDFMKYSQVVSYSKEALDRVAAEIELLAEIEGLDAHRQSINVRRMS